MMPRTRPRGRKRVVQIIRIEPCERDENNVDLTVIRENLRLTPTQRIRNMENKLRLMEIFRILKPKQ